PPSVAAVIDDKTTTVNETTVYHAGARLAIVEFSDFECPFCGKYARDVFPLVRDQLVESGRVDYVFRNFPLEKIHHNALQASQRAECAGAQRKYWEMHDRIFARQPNILMSSLADEARALELDVPAFLSCTSAPQIKIERDLSEGKR